MHGHICALTPTHVHTYGSGATEDPGCWERFGLLTPFPDHIWRAGPCASSFTCHVSVSTANPQTGLADENAAELQRCEANVQGSWRCGGGEGPLRGAPGLYVQPWLAQPHSRPSSLRSQWWQRVVAFCGASPSEALGILECVARDVGPAPPASCWSPSATSHWDRDRVAELKGPRHPGVWDLAGWWGNQRPGRPHLPPRPVAGRWPLSPVW